MPSPVIAWLEWDDENEEHLARHGITPDDVDSMIFESNWLSRRNKRSHPAGRRVFIGPTAGNQIITVVLEPGRADSWRPVTGRVASPEEVDAYRRARGHAAR